MKRDPFLKKAFCLLLLSVFLLALNACGQNDASTLAAAEVSPVSDGAATAKPAQPSDQGPSAPIDQVSVEQNEEDIAGNAALAAYNDFLAGAISAQDINHKISDGTVAIKDISLEPDFKTYYALFDMNGDQVPELHLRPVVGGSYAIFTYVDEQIVLWHTGPDYESPLNNGAILYERDGAAPTHINYYYLMLDSDGNEVSKVYFAKYHSVDESGLTESTDYDVFTFEEKEVSEEEWSSLTNEYLSGSSDLIIWNEA